jgi:hypothetical protein
MLCVATEVNGNIECSQLRECVEVVSFQAVVIGWTREYAQILRLFGYSVLTGRQ